MTLLHIISAVSVDSSGKFNFGGDFITTSPQGLVSQAVAVLSFIVGAISIIMVVVGGLMYTLSAGDPGRVRSAKDTILYAIIGMLVSLLAYSIITFVTSQIH